MKIRIHKFSNLILSVFLFLLAQGSSAALLEEVVVTAQKREQNIQDIGISVTAFNGEQIRDLGFTNTTDITALTPGLSMNQFHPSLTVMNIRGISQNDFSDHLEAPVVVYTDETYVSAMGAVGGQMFDMDRVEVLRGPQGTLFGRNATGGLVHFVSRKPTEDIEGYGEVTLGSYDQVKFEGAIGGPLTDNLLGRFSIATNQSDGYYKNRVGKDIRDADTYSVRGQLLYKANEDIEMLFKAHYATNNELGSGYTHTPAIANADGLGRAIGRNENAYGTCAGCDLIGYRDPDTDPLTNGFSQEGYFDRSVYGMTANISWEFENMTLTSITDYLGMEKNLLTDTDGTPIPFFIFISDQDFDQVSQEVRLNGETNKTRWVTGFYYLNIDTTMSQTVDIDLSFPFGLPVVLSPLGVGGTETDSWAVFGQVEYDIAEDWTLIGGVRYTEDDKEQDLTITDPFGAFFDLDTVSPDDAVQQFENFSLKAEVDWHPNDETLVYASYNRGHKGGNWAFTIVLPANTADYPAFASELPHDEEVLNSYEIGIKTDMFDGIARLNASIFYYDYNDYQSFSLRNQQTSIRNVDASVLGGEIELTLQPVERMDVLLGVSFLDAEIDGLTLPNGSTVKREMPQSPNFTLNGLIRYEWPVFNGSFSIQGDFMFTDSFNFSTFNEPLLDEDSYMVTNARLGYTTADNKWKASIFVKNIGDESYRVYAGDNSGLGFGTSTFAYPRWFGGSIAYSWN